MTNKELREKIVRLESELAGVKEKIEGLKNEVNSGGVFKPDDGQEYWLITGSGGVRDDFWGDYAIDYDYYSIGNCFPTEEAAKDTVRALKLIQKARESQGGYTPDWENWGQCKYYLCFDKGYLDIKASTSLNTAPTFGFWGDKSICEQFASENHHELIWFFKEYVR